MSHLADVRFALCPECRHEVGEHQNRPLPVGARCEHPLGEPSSEGTQHICGCNWVFITNNGA